MRHHRTQVKMAIIKKSTNKCWRGFGREKKKKEPCYTVDGSVNWYSQLWERVYREVSLKAENRVAI